MPALKTYDLFISHAWKYGASYDRLTEMLDNAPNFSYRNYSAPKDDPLKNLDGSDVTIKKEIKAAIDRKFAPVNCVVVISGMYTAYREWMQYEIDTAVRMGKPILAVRPWGGEKTPTYVQDYADEIVSWNTNSIVSAIRQLSL